MIRKPYFWIDFICMKKLFLMVFFTALIGVGFSQSNEDVEWLSLKFSAEEASAIINQGGEKLEMYLFLAKEGHSVQDVTPKDISEYTDALTVLPIHASLPPLTPELLMSDEFNSELYQFGRQVGHPVYFRIGESNILLQIHSFNRVREVFLEQQ